jgi:hypothetical protein
MGPKTRRGRTETEHVPYPAGNKPEVRGIRAFFMIMGIIGGFNM